jgi:hypothetical protein
VRDGRRHACEPMAVKRLEAHSCGDSVRCG